MEADGLKLSDDEVRERFSAFHDGELPADEAAFVRKRLDENKVLAAEYEKFSGILKGLGALANDVPEDARPGVRPVEKVDLLGDVQKRLHKRSGGKFYKSRWSRTVGVVPLEAIAAVLLVVLLLVYLGMTFITNVAPAGNGGSGGASNGASGASGGR